MVSAALFHDLFSLVDLFFVGRLGAGAISAVTISGALMGILHMLVRGIVTGSTALVAQAVGAGNRARAEKAAAQSFLMAVVLSLAAVSAMPLAPTFLRALGAQTDVVAAGTPYLAARINKERRATFDQSPAGVAKRLQPRTALTNLFLAGDAIDTGLPATIEGAIRSGERAAALVA